MLKFFRFFLLFFTLSYVPTALADDKGGGSGGGSNGGAGGTGQGETIEQIKAAAAKREEELKAEIEALKKGQKKDPDPKDDEDDLRKKVAKDKESAEEIAKQTKAIERALGFNMRIHQFVKENKDLLPAEVEALVKQADKETYDTAAHKAAVVKKAIIESYFAIASNLEPLTASQKSQLDDFFKLTKTGKESKASDIYENIFEPALETIRKVKKAEEVGRSRAGYGRSSESHNAYKDRLVSIARKTHLGEREDKRA